MMNIDVLDEHLLNSSWLSCSLPLVVLIRVSELFYESKLLVIGNLVILSVWGKIYESLDGLELKIREEKSKNTSNRPWGAAPTRAPQDRLCRALACHSNQST